MGVVVRNMIFCACWNILYNSYQKFIFGTCFPTHPSISAGKTEMALCECVCVYKVPSVQGVAEAPLYVLSP